jgi:hypothetical protein
MIQQEKIADAREVVDLRPDGRRDLPRHSHESLNSVCNVKAETPLGILYRLVDKYMRQPPALSSEVRISRRLISRVWTLRKVK